jgi:transcriptional regulator with GAF, ATPase, and Fis domain
MSTSRPRSARPDEAFDLRKKVLRLETLYDVGRSLPAARDETALLEEVLGRTVAVLDAARGLAALFETDREAGRVVAVGLVPAPDVVAVGGDPFVLDLCRARAPLARSSESVLGRPAGSVAGVPFAAGDRIFGVLVVLDREARGERAASFDEDDRRFLGSLAGLVAPALEGIRRFEALEADVDRLREENRALKGTLAIDDVLIGDSAGMRRVREIVARAAASRVNVLVTGESGTGKELVAKLLHAASPRREGPFLALNCAAVPEALLEAELFGIEKGVATGVEARVGKFELASGGTIFLDEIADAPLAIQAKLLRVLQEREIERVGGRHRIPVDVRVVSASHADLPAEIRAGRFREDLFYRLRVVEIPLPALRDRREDVPRLAAHFLAKIAIRDGRPPAVLGRDAVKALLDYPFPGNVRELENLLEGAVALSGGRVLGAADLQFGATRSEAPSTGSADLRAVEHAHIRRVLASVKGNKSRAAKILGVSRRTLYRKRV